MPSTFNETVVHSSLCRAESPSNPRTGRGFCHFEYAFGEQVTRRLSVQARKTGLFPTNQSRAAERACSVVDFARAVIDLHQ
jgi:hypothetical protein